LSTSQPEQQTTQRPRLLVVELWGIGDLALATSFLKEAMRHYEVTLLAKGYAVPLLAASFPQIEIITLQAPWTAFRGKYLLWKWPWKNLTGIWWKLLRRQFDAAVSVRNDPRDHLLMWMVGARARYGFPIKGSGIFLNRPCRHAERLTHKVVDWMTLASEMNMPVQDDSVWLNHPAYRSPKVDEWIGSAKKTVFAIHAGGSSRVRRLPLEYFEGLIQRLRGTFNFTLVIIPDPDGYGSSLAPLADIFIPSLEINELVDLLGRVALFICNDSGPAHIASCCGTPTIAFFGPAEPALFRPWGKNHLVVARDICEWRPCWDYCKFPEPKCILALKPDVIWSEIKLYIENTILPK